MSISRSCLPKSTSTGCVSLHPHRPHAPVCRPPALRSTSYTQSLILPSSFNPTALAPGMLVSLKLRAVPCQTSIDPEHSYARTRTIWSPCFSWISRGLYDSWRGWIRCPWHVGLQQLQIKCHTCMAFRAVEALAIEFARDVGLIRLDCCWL